MQEPNRTSQMYSPTLLYNTIPNHAMRPTLASSLLQPPSMASYPHLCTATAHVEMAIATLHTQAAGECSTTYHYPPASGTTTDQQRQASMENKRKQDTAGGRRRKHRRSGDAAKEAKAVAKKVANESPSGYIHVRARRGQATDSHSLAERVRREKIRERMRLLQELVPGCDKVTGRALMLDEIINYVQSLQSQVEFLSMKLASVNPIMWDIVLDDYYFEQEAVDMAPSVASPSQQAPHVHPTAYAVAANSHPILDNSYPLLLLGQGYNSGL